MTSYQANFASHPTRNRHVGFLFHGRVYENTTKCLVSFYLVHITIPNYDRVTRILKHTRGRIKSCYKVNQKKQQFLLFFSIPHHTKRKQRIGSKSYAYGCVPRRANPLIYSSFVLKTIYSSTLTLKSS